MNPIILPPAMNSSALVRQLVEEKENSEFKPVKLRLKIDLVSYSARAEGLVNMDSTRRMLELWEMWSTSSLPSLPHLLWPRVVALDRILFMGQIKLFDL